VSDTIPGNGSTGYSLASSYDYFSSAIDYNGDTDWYSVTLTAGVAYQIWIEGFDNGGGSLGDPYLGIFNAWGSFLTYNDDYFGHDPFVYFIPTSTGTYYLSAEEFGNNATGSYRITIEDDAVDSTATVASVSVNGSFYEDVGFGVDDSDWVRVSLVAGVTYQFDMIGSTNDGSGAQTLADPWLALANSAGVVLASDDDSGLGYNARIFYTPSTSGTYYLIAQEALDAAGGYRLMVNASPVAGSITAGGTVNASVDFSGDTDLYSITLSAGVLYNFTLAGGTLADPFLELLDADGAVLTSNDDYGGLNAFVSYTPASTGTYYLAARESGNDATGTYTLSVSGTSGDDYLAGTGTTGAISIGASAVGDIETGGDRDWFRVTLNAGQTYTFRLNAAVSGGLSDPYLSIYNSGGTYLAADDDSGGSLNSALVFTPSSTGTYYLEARAYGSGTGDYVLSASGFQSDGTAPTVLSFSPSDEATAVSVGSNVTLTFSESIQRGTGTIYLKTAAGTVIESFNAASSPRITISGNTLVIDPTANLANATGYRVEFSSGNVLDLAGNAYTGTTSYNFTTIAGTGGDDYAAGTGTSGAVATGGSATGHIEATGDRDWFSVSLTSGQTYTFRLNAAATGGLSDPYLSLYNSSGAYLTYDDDSGGSLSSLIRYTASYTGVYYLEARAYSYQIGDYVLSTTGTDATAPAVVSFSPADEATSVAVGSNIALVFSESIQRGTGTIYLKNASGTVIEAFDAATSSRISISGSSLSIDPTANLSNATGYRVEFAPGTVRDLAGNAYAGTTSYNFTTIAAAGGDDYAANTGTTGSVAVGSTASGNIETVSDRDWFAISLIAGQSYTFRLDPSASNGLSDPYLTLYNSAGSFVAYDDDSGGSLTSLLRYTAGYTGTYFLEARAYGSQLGGYGLTTTGSTGSDVTAPTVLGFSPVDEATSVPVGANVVVTFSEAIQRGTGTIYLKNAGGTVIEAFDAATSSRIAISGAALTIDPTASLANATGYHVEFVAGTVRDIAGNNYAGTTSYNFTTVGDVTAPTVLVFSPSDEATSVAVTSNIMLTFSESIQRGAGTIYLKNAAGVVIETYDAASSPRITVSGASLTIDPTASLAIGTGYRVELAPGSVYDLSGNAYAGTTSYNFTTVASGGGDDYAANTGTTGFVATGGSATGHIETVGDRDWFAVNLTAGQAYSFALNAAASNSLSDPYLSLYNSAGALLGYNDDGGGNLNSLLHYTATTGGTYYLEARAYSSGVGDYTLSTTGAAATDVTAPTVLTFSPADEAASVAVGANVVLTFSESIQRGTGTIYLKNAYGSVVESLDAATSSRISISGSTLTIDPTADLANATGYRVEFAAGTVHDLAGNAWAGASSYNFTTVSDVTAPTVLSFNPPDEAASVAVSSNVLVMFSESIQRGTGTIYLKNGAGTIIESFDAASSSRIAISGASLALDPTSNLANSTGYRVEFGAGTVHDLAGNWYAGTSSYNFTTVAAMSGDDYAANTGTTGSVTSGGSVTGHIETTGDRDWFGVSLTAGQSYTFRLDGAATNGLSDPYLSLYNGSGSLLGSNDDGAGAGTNSLLTFTPTSSGTYYLEARAYSTQVGDYTLGVTAATGGGGGGGSGTSGFSISVSYTGNAALYQSYFTAAAARWAEIIVGDLPDVNTAQGLIDDLGITANIAPIDGAGSILGYARFTAVRTGSNLPYLGEMTFDEADVTRMISDGTFGDVVLHEMGHVLGMSGSLWQYMGLTSSSNPYEFYGANAVQAYDSLAAGTQYYVPVESGGGQGTAGSHWSEAVFDKELMTGYANGTTMPISIITVGALDDLGYTVNYAAADPYTL